MASTWILIASLCLPLAGRECSNADVPINGYLTRPACERDRALLERRHRLPVQCVVAYE